MTTIPTRLALLSLAAVAGCDWIHAATADKLDSGQRDAMADLLSRTGTLAGVFADPATATADDLADAMALDHFVRLLGTPGAAARVAWAAPAPAPACLATEGDTVTATACEVPVAGVTCLVDGHATRTAGAGTTTYAGEITMTGTGCPQRTITFDFALAGATDSPTGLDGGVDFSENTPGNVYSGHLQFSGVGLADGCSVPSKGSLTVDVTGTFAGAPVDGAITVSFNSTPECGVLLIE